MKKKSATEPLFLWHFTSSNPPHLPTFLKERGISSDAINQLGGLFCPEGCYQQFGPSEVYWLMGYLTQGVFSMDLRRGVRSLPDPQAMGIPFRCNETDLHRALKGSAVRWLARHAKAKEVEFEVPYQSRVADVASKDGLWFVECGASRPSKVLDFFMASDDRRKLVILNREAVAVFSAGPHAARYREVFHDHMARLVQATGLGGLHGD